MTRILAIAAHPDDVELGCSGLLQRYSQRRILIMTCGEQGGAAPMRRGEAIEAAAVLEASATVLDFPDTLLEVADLIPVIEAEIAATRPTVIATLSDVDLHQDHRAVAIATEIAARDAQCTILAYVTPSAAERWRPNWFVNLTEAHMARKLQALRCHRSQQDRRYLSDEYVRGMGHYWAMVERSRAAYVEPFALVRHREP